MIDTFPPELAAFVHSEIAAGKYPSESALVVAAVELLRDQEEQEELLRQEIQLGIDELDRGEGTRYDATTSHLFAEKIMREGRRLLAAQANAEK